MIEEADIQSHASPRARWGNGGGGAKGTTDWSKRALIAAGVLAALALCLSARQMGYLGWPSAKVEILGAKVVREQARERPGAKPQWVARSEIQYRDVAARGDSPDTGWVGTWSKDLREAERFVARHPPGTLVVTGRFRGAPAGRWRSVHAAEVDVA